MTFATSHYCIHAYFFYFFISWSKTRSKFTDLKPGLYLGPVLGSWVDDQTCSASSSPLAGRAAFGSAAARVGFHNW